MREAVEEQHEQREQRHLAADVADAGDESQQAQPAAVARVDDQAGDGRGAAAAARGGRAGDAMGRCRGGAAARPPRRRAVPGGARLRHAERSGNTASGAIGRRYAKASGSASELQLSCADHHGSALLTKPSS